MLYIGPLLTGKKLVRERNKKGKHEICSQKIAAVVKLKQNVKIKT